MRVFRIVILALFVGVALSFVGVRTNTAQSNGLQELQDRAAIQSLIVRYGTALDTLDADGYAGVFTQDAELDVAGNVRKGRQEIRQIVTGLQESRAAAKANGTRNGQWLIRSRKIYPFTN